MLKSNETKRRIQSCLDSAQALFRGDDGLYARDLVNQTLSEVYLAQYPDLGWASGDLLPFKSQVDPGAFSYDYISAASAGRAKIMAPGASDIPRADVSVTRDMRAIVSLMHSFSFTSQDLRSSAMMRNQGLDFDVPSLLADACRYGHDLELNDLIAFGSEANGLFGITNHPGIIVANATTGDWLNPATTADQIYADVVAAWTQQKLTTRGTKAVIADHLVVSSSIMGRLMTTFINSANGSNITLLLAIEQNLKVRVVEEETMSLASESGDQAALFFKKDAKSSYAVMPLYLAPQEPEKHNGNILTIMESRFGGVASPYPRSILRLDGL